MVVDIVCGRKVDPDAIDAAVRRAASGASETDPARGTKAFYEGSWYYFCSMACRHAFVATPDALLEKARPRP